MSQTKSLGLAFSLSLLSMISLLALTQLAVAAAETPEDIPQIVLPQEDWQALRLIRPYRTWFKINREPIRVDFNELALTG
jgi:hypothetical protein